MILGRSAEKIKIKTDSPKGLRAVECGCCQSCNCQNRPTEKYKFISTNFAAIDYQDTRLQCFSSYPGDPYPTVYYAFAVLSNGGGMTLIYRNCDGTGWRYWEVTLYNFDPAFSWMCQNLSADPGSIDPTGTHQFYPLGPECYDWTVTIGLDV